MDDTVLAELVSQPFQTSVFYDTQKGTIYDGPLTTSQPVVREDVRIPFSSHVWDGFTTQRCTIPSRGTHISNIGIQCTIKTLFAYSPNIDTWINENDPLMKQHGIRVKVDGTTVYENGYMLGDGCLFHIIDTCSIRHNGQTVIQYSGEQLRDLYRMIFTDATRGTYWDRAIFSNTPAQVQSYYEPSVQGVIQVPFFFQRMIPSHAGTWEIDIKMRSPYTSFHKIPCRDVATRNVSYEIYNHSTPDITLESYEVDVSVEELEMMDGLYSVVEYAYAEPPVSRLLQDETSISIPYLRFHGYDYSLDQPTISSKNTIHIRDYLPSYNTLLGIQMYYVPDASNNSHCLLRTFGSDFTSYPYYSAQWCPFTSIECMFDDTRILPGSDPKVYQSLQTSMIAYDYDPHTFSYFFCYDKPLSFQKSIMKDIGGLPTKDLSQFHIHTSLKEDAYVPASIHIDFIYQDEYILHV